MWMWTEETTGQRQTWYPNHHTKAVYSMSRRPGPAICARKCRALATIWQAWTKRQSTKSFKSILRSPPCSTARYPFWLCSTRARWGRNWGPTVTVEWQITRRPTQDATSCRQPLGSRNNNHHPHKKWSKIAIITTGTTPLQRQLISTI